MSAECVVAEFENDEKARLGLEVLQKSHFPQDAISVLSHKDSQVAKQFDRKQAMGAEQEMTGERSAGLGALVGGTAAAPFAVTSMVGPFFLAGPLAGMAVGAVVGGLFNELKSKRATDLDTTTFAERVEQGAILLVVTGSDIQLEDAAASLKTADPRRLERLPLAQREEVE